MNLGCVVMASGYSRRFGSNKLLTPFLGGPLLCHALAALPRNRLSKTLVVTRWPEVEVLCGAFGLPCLRHDLPHLSDTVRLGVEAMEGADGCLFLVGDQPLCQTESLNRLLDAFQRNPTRPARLCAGGIPGNPILFPASYFPALANLQGEKGGGSLLTGAVTLVEAGHPDELADGDTPALLRRLENSPLAKMHRESPPALCNEINVQET